MSLALAQRPAAVVNANVPYILENAELTPERFAAAMAVHGVVMIRGLFEKREAEDLVREVEDLFSLIDNLQHNGLLTENAVTYLKGGHPASLIPNLPLLQNLLDKSSFVKSLQQHFGEEELVCYAEPTGIRYCNPQGWQNYLPWHQDLLAREDHFLTIWVPLNRVGDDAPGLEVVPVALKEKLSSVTGLDVSYDNKGIPDEQVRERFGPEQFHPVMDVGDVMVFSPYAVHRTYFSPGMTKSRISLDVRLNPKSRNPMKAEGDTEVLHFPGKGKVERKGGSSSTLFNVRHLLVPLASHYAASANPAAAPALSQRLTARAARKLRRVMAGNGW